jgi:hypothetical protein
MPHALAGCSARDPLTSPPPPPPPLSTHPPVLQVSSNIEHREPRVRTCVVDVLEWLSRRTGTGTYVFIQDKVLTSILTNFTRSGESDDEDEGGDGPGRAGAGVGPGRERSPSPGPRSPSPSPGAGSGGDGASVGSGTSSARGRKPRIAHDTVGWKALESSIKAIRGCIVGCGRAFVTEGLLTPQLREDIIPRAAAHVNRFVREAIMYLLDAVGDVGTQEDLCGEGFDEAMAGLLARGLCDNWSQVSGPVLGSGAGARDWGILVPAHYRRAPAIAHHQHAL